MKPLGLIALLVLVGLICGCPQKPKETVTAAPAESPPEPLPAYPHDQIPAAEPQPAPSAAGSTTPAVPPPVDTKATAKTEKKAKQKPKESYAPSEKQAVRHHTVRKGETLQTISKKYYGTTKKWQAILKANKNVVSDPDKLQVGTKLVIP